MSSVGFNTVKLSATLTRPANTTAYTAGDAVTDNVTGLLLFNNAARNSGRTGSIDSATVLCSANQATKPDLELWLFSKSIASTADNAAWAPSDTEILDLIGVISFPVASFKVANAGAGVAGNVVQNINNIGQLYKLDAEILYAQLVVRNAYTPTSSEIFIINLLVSLD